MSETRERLIREEERLQKEFDENREEHARLLEEMANAVRRNRKRLATELTKNRRRFAKLYNDLRLCKVNLLN